ncbi:uncharacterized protein LOC142251834 [Anomaloglossus baeobatrachus]|uniref:uncharacterized protein LOC142251834 n=1 Tax=Anomaloglossus baeobatrachus TaxID=238106 RepID=UPI003F508F20
MHSGAPIFFVKKKEGTLRPCIDYRELNKITIRNRYPLPLIPELLERVQQAKIFTKLDLRGAYNLLRIRPGDEWKTAFRCRYGHFEYLVMPFGLCNAPAAFQHLVNDIFRDIMDQFMVIYLDDILIFSDSLQEHQEHVKTVLTRLRENHLYIKLEKCEFHCSQIQFLGYVISPQGLNMESGKIQAILDWPEPGNIKEVQRFVGFANFYRRFIRNFSEIVRPITLLTKKGQKFVWSTQAQEAFHRLKVCFTSAPILVHPNPALPFIVEVDASDYALGAILSQRTGDKSLLHPCAFFSRRLSPAERNYDIADKELLAIISAFKEWRHHLQGAAQQVIVLTDHRNLEFLKSARCLSPRQARWSLFLSQFNFIVTYRPGSRNGKADALSRIHAVDSVPGTPSQTVLSDANFVGVINLSERELNSIEIGLLKRGHSFVPTSNFDLFESVKDLNLFLRKLRWRKHFRRQDARICQDLDIPTDLLPDIRLLNSLELENPNLRGQGPFTTLRNKISNTPPVLGDLSAKDIFEELVTNDLRKLAVTNVFARFNLSKMDIQALKGLENDDHIVIKPSDKSGNVVVMDTAWYVDLCLALLGDRDGYEVLPRNPTKMYFEELKVIIDEGLTLGVIDKSEYDFQYQKNPVMATFYCLPKVHKGLHPLKGRPIVSGINSLTQNCRIYLDQILRPFVMALQSHIQDTPDLLLDLVKRRWRSARDQYRREYNPMPSSSSQGRKRRYVYYEQISFLAPILEVTQTEDNLDESDDEPTAGPSATATSASEQEPAREDIEIPETQQDAATESHEGGTESAQTNTQGSSTQQTTTPATQATQTNVLPRFAPQPLRARRIRRPEEMRSLPEIIDTRIIHIMNTLIPETDAERFCRSLSTSLTKIPSDRQERERAAMLTLLILLAEAAFLANPLIKNKAVPSKV